MLSRIQDDWTDSSLALDSGGGVSRRASLVFTARVCLQRESGQLLTWNTDNGTGTETVEWRVRCGAHAHPAYVGRPAELIMTG